MANNTEKRITAKMILDSTGYNGKLKGLNAEMKKHQSELKLASEGIKTFGKDSEKLKSVQESLSKQVELHSKKVDLYKNSIEKTTSKMNDNIKKRDELKKSLDDANRKYNETVKIYGKESTKAKKAKEEVDRLKEEHNKASKAVESNAKSIQNYETNMNKANAQMVKTEGELKKVNSELDKSNNKWLKASESLKKSSEKMKNIGSAVSGAGDKMLKLTAPLAAGGIASLKFATDFEDSIAKVSTIADNTQVPVDKLRKDILKLSSDTGIASTEIANNTYDAISAGQKTGDAVNFVKNSTKLAKAGFAEAGQSLDVLTTIMNAYKMKAEDVTKVSDYLITTQNEGKVTVGELSSVMGKVIPTAVATSTGLNQVTTGYALMTKNGIKAAESTTYMNSMLNEMSKTGSTADKAIRAVSGKSFPELMQSGKSVSDVLNMMNDYAKKNKLSLKDMFGSAEAGKAALVLSTNAGKDFTEMLGKMEQSAGATGKAFDKVTNTKSERFKKSLNKMKNEAIRFGDAISPMMDKVSDLIGKISDKLDGLSDEQLQNIAKWGMMAIATGGFLKVGGKVVNGLGSVIGVIGKVTEFMGKFKTATDVAGGASAGATGKVGLLSKAFKLSKNGAGLASAGFTKLAGAVGLSVPAMGLAVAGVAGVSYGLVKLGKHLKKDAVPAIDLFSDRIQKVEKINKQAVGGIAKSYQKMSVGISKETKKAVGAYINLDNNVKKSLNNLYINSTKISKKTAKSLTDTYNQMGNKIKQGMDKKNVEQIKSMQDFFNKSKNISKKEQEQMLNNLKNNNDKQKKEIDSYNKQIEQILKNASDKNRELTLDEQQKINSIQDKMRVNAVKSLSKEEVESKAILERLKSYGARVTAEQASEVIKNAEKQRKGAVEKANQQYDQTVKNIIKMRDESKIISADQADKMIKEAERQKKETIDKAEQLKKGVVKKIAEQNSQVLKDVNSSSGEILSKWEKLKNWWHNWHPIKKFFSAETKTNSSVGHNWTGNKFWEGGLTYLHDAPGTNSNYELYDLPRGTRMFNHDASIDLVKQTAENVATKVANSVLKNFEGLGANKQEQTIIVPVSLNGREIARVTARPMSEELSRLNKRGGLGYV